MWVWQLIGAQFGMTMLFTAIIYLIFKISHPGRWW